MCSVDAPEQKDTKPVYIYNPLLDSLRNDQLHSLSIARGRSRLRTDRVNGDPTIPINFTGVGKTDTTTPAKPDGLTIGAMQRERAAKPRLTISDEV